MTYRLPTEAEWEHACRAGTITKYYWGDSMNGEYAYYWENSGKETHDVGRKLPNAWGLYDMSGNVYECCDDWWGPYSSSSQIDPEGPSSGEYRVLRGGRWEDNAWFLRSSCRYWYRPVKGYDYGGGFRIIREVE